jgi:hypothetical protein
MFPRNTCDFFPVVQFEQLFESMSDLDVVLRLLFQDMGSFYEIYVRQALLSVSYPARS